MRLIPSVALAMLLGFAATLPFVAWANDTSTVGAPADAVTARAWEGRYVVLGPRCGYRTPDWAAALGRGLRQPPVGAPPGGRNGVAEAEARRAGAAAGAALAGQHLFDRFGATSCETFTDGTSLAAADRDAQAGAADPATPEAPLPPDWLNTIWPEEAAALLSRCNGEAVGPEPRAALLAGLNLVARTEGLPMTADVVQLRTAAALGALAVLDDVGARELVTEGRAACVRAGSDAANTADAGLRP